MQWEGARLPALYEFPQRAKYRLHFSNKIEVWIFGGWIQNQDKLVNLAGAETFDKRLVVSGQFPKE